MSFSIWVLMAGIAQLVFAVEQSAVCASSSCHGLDALALPFPDVSMKISSMVEDASNQAPGKKSSTDQRFRALKPNKIKPWIERRNLELKKLCHTRAMNTSEGQNNYFREYYNTISDWNKATYENLRRQFQSEKHRGQVVIMSSGDSATWFESFKVTDKEHLNAASVWLELGIDVLFYFEQKGEHDVGDTIRLVSDLALEAGAQVHVLLQDHFTGMNSMLMQPHNIEVLRDVPKENKLFSLSILTCEGKELQSRMKDMIAKTEQILLEPGAIPPEVVSGLQDWRNNLKNFDIIPSETSLSVKNGCRGKGIYRNAVDWRYSSRYRLIAAARETRLTDIEEKVNAFFDFKVFTATSRTTKQRSTYKQVCDTEEKPCQL